MGDDGVGSHINVVDVGMGAVVGVGDGSAAAIVYQEGDVQSAGPDGPSGAFAMP
jgi:hypothetical protein